VVLVVSWGSAILIIFSHPNKEVFEPIPTGKYTDKGIRILEFLLMV
jgi:hypothetical protein